MKKTKNVNDNIVVKYYPTNGEAQAGLKKYIEVQNITYSYYIGFNNNEVIYKSGNNLYAVGYNNKGFYIIEYCE
jgi:hypothetical protein